jgi:excisionase family DNA binding protein
MSGAYMANKNRKAGREEITPIAWDIELCSQYTSIKVATLRKFIQQKRIPYIKCGKKVLFRPAVIDRWLDGGGAGSRSFAPTGNESDTAEQLNGQ